MQLLIRFYKLLLTGLPFLLSFVNYQLLTDTFLAIGGTTSTKFIATETLALVAKGTAIANCFTRVNIIHVCITAKFAGRYSQK